MIEAINRVSTVGTFSISVLSALILCGRQDLRGFRHLLGSEHIRVH